MWYTYSNYEAMNELSVWYIHGVWEVCMQVVVCVVYI